MCMVEGAACWHASIELIGADVFIHYFQLDELFADTWGFTKAISEITALKTLRRSNVLLLQIFMFASLGLNLCKCIDMMLTISDPFFPAHRRMKWYYLTTVIIAFGFTFCTIGEGIGI